MSDFELHLSRLLNVKLKNNTFGLPIYDYLLVFNQTQLLYEIHVFISLQSLNDLDRPFKVTQGQYMTV